MFTVRRRIVTLFALCFLLPIYASAEVEGNIADPNVLVQSVIDDVVTLIRGDRGDEAGKRRRTRGYLEDKLSPHVDFKKMMQQAMGRNWRHATEVERTELAEQFQLLLINVYASVFLEHKDGSIRCLPSRFNAGDTEASVRVEYSGTVEKISMVIFMERTGGVWRAHNIEIEGISLVFVYQESFRNEINKGGVVGLINTLKMKNAKIK